MARLRARIGPVARVCAALALLLGAGGGTGRTGDSEPVPGARLARRVEAHLASPAVQERLARLPGHASLVFPVAPSDLHASMESVRVVGRSGHRALVTRGGPEPHGGGVLALLLRAWRPQGRAARLSDRYPFAGTGGGVPLEALYASLRRQVFLPVPGRTPEALAGALPRTPQLARVRVDLRDAGLPWPPQERDAWHALGLLAEHEPAPEATWTNALGQELSVRLLLDHAGRHYLKGRDHAAEPTDHSELHLVELLLGAGPTAAATPPEAIQRRFLRVELRRRVFEADEALLLGHHAESLGVLVADPRVRWSPAQARQVAEWLAWLERERFRELADADPRELTHLLRGLRAVQRHAERLGS